MITFYLLIKSLHIISVVAWFAGLFYLPRLFVYHVEHPEAAATLHIMEDKLMRIIMRPALAATTLFGIILLVINPSLLSMGWMQLKLFLVSFLFIYHGSLEMFAGRFRRGQNTHSGKFFRMYNEVPTLLLIIIVILAEVKPF